MVVLMRAGLSPCANLQAPSGLGQCSALLNTSQNKHLLAQRVYSVTLYAGKC